MQQLDGLKHGEIAVDHVGHWVPDADRAKRALDELGFVVTPWSEQQQPDADGVMTSAGAGNQCVMLQAGYLEYLTPLADTPVGLELRNGIDRYVGMHIAAFAVADAGSWRDRLVAAGFPQKPATDLRRAVDAGDGTTREARFSVVRPVAPGFAEGRFQGLVHHTPDVLWQPRWITHPNSVSALTALVVLVENLAEATRRFERWFGCRSHVLGNVTVIKLEFGEVWLVDRTGMRALIPDAAHRTDSGIVASVLSSADPGVLESRLNRNRHSGIGWLTLDPDLGGVYGLMPSGKEPHALLSG